MAVNGWRGGHRDRLPAGRGVGSGGAAAPHCQCVEIGFPAIGKKLISISAGLLFCKATGKQLAIARLDRLFRNVPGHDRQAVNGWCGGRWDPSQQPHCNPSRTGLGTGGLQAVTNRWGWVAGGLWACQVVPASILLYQ
jgi:hypothetical protein